MTLQRSLAVPIDFEHVGNVVITLHVICKDKDISEYMVQSYYTHRITAGYCPKEIHGVITDFFPTLAEARKNFDNLVTECKDNF
jgi:hypothetical protein